MPIQSMTGYGKAEALTPEGKYTVEIRSLNGKSADISIKSNLLPKDKEIPLRKRLAERLTRGTIDLFLSFEPNGSTPGRKLDTDLIQTYLTPLESLIGEADSAARASLIASILRFPDFNETKRPDIISEENWPLVESAIEAALDAIEAFRRQEGASLMADISSRVDTILSLYDEIEALEGERIDAVRKRLLKNLDELHEKVDPSRFEQELIFYLEKYDINEEKVRLRQHCRYFMETLTSEPTPGKKLGFIIQEMGREINTTGSKANHALIQQRVVRMKDELEKIREQSMNIL